MALKVWLPLDGNINNYGISNINLTSAAGQSFVTPGKIGEKCLKTSNTVQDLGYSGGQINSGSLSFGGWFKFNQSEIATILNAKSYTSTASTATGNLIGNNSYGGISLQWWSNNIYSSGSFSSLTVQTYVRSSTNGARSGTQYTIPFDTWIHIFLVFDKSINKCHLYINGTLYHSLTVVDFTDATTNNLQLNKGAIAGGNGPSAQIPFYCNDVRIYDVALSDLEIREISQGLILHYKLDNGNLGNPNILINTHFDTRYSQTTGWDTSKNGTLLANSWGGYNSGVSNQATVYHAHLKQIDDEYVYEYIKTANESWLGISQGGLQSKLTAGQTYTFSWEQYCVEGANYVATGLYYYKSGASSAAFHLGLPYGNTNRQLGVWQKFTYTFIAPSDGDYSKNMSWYIYGHYGGNGIMYVRHPKLELGSFATNWMPASTETLYGALMDNKIEDSSGYNHHGTVIGSITYSGPSARYSAAADFDGNTSGILIENLNISDIINSSVTYSFWIKPNGENGARSVYFGSYSGTSWSIEKTTGNVLRSYWNSSPDETCSGASIVDGEWQHICIVKNGTNNIKVYINGVQKWTSTSTHNILTFPTTFRIGRDVRSGDGTPYKGQMSDFRIYATALVDNDIKKLYNVGMSIDKGYNTHTFELVEEEQSVSNVTLVNNGATSVVFDNTTGIYTVTSPVGTSSWGYGVKLNTNPSLIIPYGKTYRWSCEVYTPVQITFASDYNNYEAETFTSTGSWNGNDNDLISARLANTVTVPANTWTRIVLGSTNAHASNTEHKSIKDFSSLGARTDGLSDPLVWYIRNVQWGLVSDTPKTKLKKTGQLIDTHFTETDMNITKISKKLYSFITNEFIER